MRVRRLAFLGLLLSCICMGVLSACDLASSSVQAAYQPPFLPVVFAINSNGTISVTAKGNITTPIGDFSVEAGGYPVQSEAAIDTTKLTVIIRHAVNKKSVDSVWTLTTNDEEISVTTDGHTQITVTAHRVFVDATKSVIRQLIVKDLRPISYALGDESHSGFSLAWSPDGKYIAVGDVVGQIQIFEALTARQVRVIKSGDGFVPSYIAWSPDGKMLASSSTDAQIYLFDAASGDTITHFPDSAANHSQYSLGWSPNGKFIVEDLVDVGADQSYVNPMLNVFDAHTGKILVSRPGYSANPLCGWSPDGNEFTSLTPNIGVQIWDVATGSVRYTFPKETGIPCFSHSGQRIATVGVDSDIVRIFDAHTDAHPIEFPDHGAYSLAWSVDDTRILTENTHVTDTQKLGPTAEIWNAQTGNTIVVYQYPYLSYQQDGQTYYVIISNTVWSPDGAYIAVLFGNKVDIQSGNQ